MSITIRDLAHEELPRIGEIDRSEKVSTGYRYRRGALEPVQVDWLIPRWTDGADGEFNLGHRIRVLEERMQRGEIPIGAFDGIRLAGFIVLRLQLTETMAQCAELFVDRKARRQGVATQLLDEIVRRARATGHTELYVSSVPSKSAVNFYRSKGFRPTDEPHPELMALEPDDIHMVLAL